MFLNIFAIFHKKFGLQLQIVDTYVLFVNFVVNFKHRVIQSKDQTFSCSSD